MQNQSANKLCPTEQSLKLCFWGLKIRIWCECVYLVLLGDAYIFSRTPFGHCCLQFGRFVVVERCEYLIRLMYIEVKKCAYSPNLGDLYPKTWSWSVVFPPTRVGAPFVLSPPAEEEIQRWLKYMIFVMKTLGNISLVMEKSTLNSQWAQLWPLVFTERLLLWSDFRIANKFYHRRNVYVMSCVHTILELLDFLSLIQIAKKLE